ncbi:GDNF family receptor alpha-like [Mugil cephalus]|uniref:GDNF family receptor alpha-like n=1 Tax=Mugil cephalus TaxID=48193 RepID=UPI001FB75F3F|nr:GDNF family receptor alpha-like [Mugil cephalus]XP_047459878.1 GDNF family receptor alpha-like [Mugil cephalus]
MQLIHLEAAVVLGIITQISSDSISSPSPDCFAAVNTCMSDLCRSERAFYGGICEDEACQIKGSEVCNMTIQTILDQLPSLQGCVCDWEEELCDSIQVLATQCQPKPAVQQKRSTVAAWQSSTLIDYVYDAGGSCFERFRVCIGDAVCNRNLAPVLQACMGEQCGSEGCRQATQQFYGDMPQNLVEMLVMCECDAADQSCLQTKTDLHSGTCGDETWICQDAVNRCVEDSNCRRLLKTFQAKCWSPEEAQCSDHDLQREGCFIQMDPTLIHGTDSECKMAFVGTLGTALHHPCTCKGVHNNDLRMCNMIQNTFHNKSHFIISSHHKDIKGSGDPKPPEVNDAQHAGSHEYLLYGFATLLLAGVLILMPLAIVSKICSLRKRDGTKFHHAQKHSGAVL